MRTANALHRPHTPRDPDRGRLTRRLMSGGGPPRGPAVPRPTGEGTSAGATFLGGVVSLALTVSAFLAYGSAVDTSTNTVASDFGGAPQLGMLAIACGVFTLVLGIARPSPARGSRLKDAGLILAAIAVALAVLAGLLTVALVDNT
ncbi:MAG: hypothetical protein U0237_18005 [Thermoleophilia bacterium]